MTVHSPSFWGTQAGLIVGCLLHGLPARIIGISADGNITYTVLQGTIAVSFTGMGVRHGDGRRLQRTGCGRR